MDLLVKWSVAQSESGNTVNCFTIPWYLNNQISSGYFNKYFPNFLNFNMWTILGCDIPDDKSQTANWINGRSNERYKAIPVRWRNCDASSSESKSSASRTLPPTFFAQGRSEPFAFVNPSSSTIIFWYFGLHSMWTHLGSRKWSVLDAFHSLFPLHRLDPQS